MRKELPIGTLIRIHHHTYRITGASIGSGGGSIVYPCSQVIHNPDGTEKTSIDFVLKECFPAPHRQTGGIPSIAEFVRNEKGEIVPATEDENEWAYLSIVKKMQNNEEVVSKEVYRKGFRLIPVYEKADTAELSFDNGSSFHKVNNTYALMESLYNKGQSLKTLLEESGHALSVQVSVHLIEQILRALKEVHDSGYLHLDIQDNNLFIKGSLDDHSDMVSLIDFGSSRICTADGFTEPISNRVIFSTEGFTAPEILSGNDGTLRLNPAADLYSIGYLLLYLLTGVKYTTDELKNVVGQQYLSSRKLKKLKVPKHLTEKLQTILARSLAPDVKDRYQSCDAMLEDISALYAALTPYRSDLDQVVYDAFICYKHGRDSEVAQKLQFYLEHLKVPMRIKGQTAKIQNVFVDKGELAACADMGLVIADALKNSGWLIVICSAETKNSKWVNEEINTFLKYHDSSRILPLLTEGEPEDVYPEALLKLQKETGKEFKAADGRESTEKKVLKKVRKETVNEIAAPMLGTTFATLMHRKQTYRIKCILAVSLAVLCVVSAFSAKIFLQEQKYQEAYRKQLLLYSEALTEYAQDYAAEGRTNKAIESLLQALPGGSENELEKNRPYYPKAQYELTDLLGIYKHSEVDNPSTKAFASSDAVDDNEAFQLTDFVVIDDYIFGKSDSYDTGESLHVWNSSGEILNTISFDADFEILNYKLPDSTDLILYNHSSIKRINFLTNEIVWDVSARDDNPDGFWYIADLMLTTYDETSLFALETTDHSVCIAQIDLMTGNVLEYYECSDSQMSDFGMYTDEPSSFIINHNESALFITIGDSRYSVNLFDFTTKKATSIQLPENIWAINDVILDANDPKTVFISYRSDYTDDHSMARLIAVDTENGDILWNQETSSPDSFCYLGIFTEKSIYNQYLIWTTNNKIQLIDRSNGSIYAVNDQIDGYVVKLSIENDTFYAVTNTGAVYQFLTPDQWIKSEGLAPNAEQIQKVYGDDTYFCLRSDHNLLKYVYTTGNDNYHAIEGALPLFTSLISANERWLCLGNSNCNYFFSSDICIIDQSQNTLSTIALKDLIPDLSDPEDSFDTIQILGIVGDELYYILSETFSLDFMEEEESCLTCRMNLSSLKKNCRPIPAMVTEGSCSFNEETECFAILDGYNFGNERLSVSLYNFRDDTFEKIALPDSIAYAYHSMYHLSENGSKIVFSGKSTDENDYIYVFDLNSKKLDYQISIDDCLQVTDKQYEYIASDDENNRVFPSTKDFEYLALINPNSISVYHSGKLLNTIPFEQYGLPNMDVYFSDDTKYLYLLIGNHLLKYSIKDACMLGEEMLPALNHNGKYSFVSCSSNPSAPEQELYITDGTNFLSIHSDADSFGTIAFVEGAFYYDPTQERYYTIHDPGNEKDQLGYFEKLSLEDLLAKGKEKIRSMK